MSGPAPTAVRQLADWGADVIKIESPDGDAGLGGERHGPDFQNLHRNKRSLTLNLKSPDGIAVMKRLVANADVVVENYRPDVKFRLGVDYETLQTINPRIVYASISVSARMDPIATAPFRSDRPGHGRADVHHRRTGTRPDARRHSVADLTAGIFAAMGILIALLEREQSGQGQWVKSSLLGAQISMLDFQSPLDDRQGSSRPGRQQSSDQHPNRGFRDGRRIHQHRGAGDDIYRRLCTALATEHLATDPLYATGRERSGTAMH